MAGRSHLNGHIIDSRRSIQVSGENALLFFVSKNDFPTFNKTLCIRRGGGGEQRRCTAGASKDNEGRAREDIVWVKRPLHPGARPLRHVARSVAAVHVILGPHRNDGDVRARPHDGGDAPQGDVGGRDGGRSSHRPRGRPSSLIDISVPLRPPRYGVRLGRPHHNGAGPRNRTWPWEIRRELFPGERTLDDFKEPQQKISAIIILIRHVIDINVC